MECTRDNEIVARLGGDEFVIILNTSAAKPMKEAEIVASRIISRINQPVMIKGRSFVWAAVSGPLSGLPMAAIRWRRCGWRMKPYISPSGAARTG